MAPPPLLTQYGVCVVASDNERLERNVGFVLIVVAAQENLPVDTSISRERIGHLSQRMDVRHDLGPILVFVDLNQRIDRGGVVVAPEAEDGQETKRKDDEAIVDGVSDHDDLSGRGANRTITRYITDAPQQIVIGTYPQDCRLKRTHYVSNPLTVGKHELYTGVSG